MSIKGHDMRTSLEKSYKSLGYDAIFEDDEIYCVPIFVVDEDPTPAQLLRAIDDGVPVVVLSTTSRFPDIDEYSEWLEIQPDHKDLIFDFVGKEGFVPIIKKKWMDKVKEVLVENEIEKKLHEEKLKVKKETKNG